MTPWAWWWLADGEDEYGGWEGEFDTAHAAIADATRKLPAGTPFEIIEAPTSTAIKYEEAECVPFLRTRNRAAFVAPSLVGAG